MVERKKAEDLAILRLRRMGISEEGRGESEIPVFQRGVATWPLNEAIVVWLFEWLAQINVACWLAAARKLKPRTWVGLFIQRSGFIYVTTIFENIFVRSSSKISVQFLPKQTLIVQPIIFYRFLSDRLSDPFLVWCLVLVCQTAMAPRGLTESATECTTETRRGNTVYQIIKPYPLTRS